VREKSGNELDVSKWPENGKPWKFFKRE